jgi:hypothetical protein
MLVYKIRSGRCELNGKFIAVGYSGDVEHRNNPLATNLHGKGPIPVGVYWVSDEPRESQDLGMFVLDLVPVPGTETLGRGDFRIHGDSKTAPGTASHGCVILDHHTREAIHQSGVKLLVVLAD